MPRLHPVHSVGTRGQTHNSFLQVNTSWVPLVTNHIPVRRREEPLPSTTTEGWVPDDSDDNDDPFDGSRDEAGTQDGGNDDPVALEGANRKALFPCEVDGCTKVFQSYYNWFRHISIGKHTKRVERQSIRDYSIDKYVENIKQSQALSGLPQIIAAIESMRDQNVAPTNVAALPVGWALKTRRETKRFTPAQVAYLTAKFNVGAQTGIKHNPQDIAEMMRREAQFPEKTDWLTWTQIQGFWSRLAKQRERKQPANQAQAVPDEDENEIDLEAAGDDEYVNDHNRHIDESIQGVIDAEFEYW